MGVPGTRELQFSKNPKRFLGVVGIHATPGTVQGPLKHEPLCCATVGFWGKGMGDIAMPLKELGLTLQRMRIRRGLSQERAAKLIYKMSRASVANIETGRQRMLWHAVNRIIKRFKGKS